MVLMGIALGNLPLPHREALDDFQHHVMAFLVAAVYVLLASDVKLSDLGVIALPGLVVTAVLALLVRPLLVLISARGSALTMPERVFVSLIGPRGVVAASLAGVVAVEAGGNLGTDEGEFVAAVFVVISATILVQSTFAGPLARWLKVYPLTTVIAGAGESARRLAGKLTAGGESVVLIDDDDEAVMRAREEGFEVIRGDATSLEVLKKAGVANARAFVVALPDAEKSLLAAQHARTSLNAARIVARVDDPANFGVFEAAGVLVVSPGEAVATEMADVLASAPHLDALAAPDEGFEAIRVTVTNPEAQTTLERSTALRGTIVLLLRRHGRAQLPNGKTALQLGDQLTLFGPSASVANARRALSLGGEGGEE
jgi:Trk K+ transport system NAD-binding subunit